MKELLYAPVKGEIKDITECPDIAFSQKMLGDGIMVIPSDGIIVSPCDGVIASVMDTGHAVGIQSSAGNEILIHVGIDTVEMEGRGFSPAVKQGDRVKTGQKLLVAELSQIKKEGFDTATMLIVVSAEAALQKLNLNMDVQEYVEVISCEN